MVETFLKPRDAAEAAAMLAANPGSLPVAGGTQVLARGFRAEPMTLVSLAGILPSSLVRRGDNLEIGANASFQEILDSSLAPPVLRAACMGMADRNIRNRATAGGNAGAGKSCSSLVPLFLAAEAVYALAGAGEMDAEDWQLLPADGTRPLIAAVRLRLPEWRRYACGRWSRTSCDVSMLTGAVALTLAADGSATNVRIALGGLGPSARRFPEIELVFEGLPLPGRDGIEAAVAPLLHPVDDHRAGAAFKRARAAALVADLLLAAEVQP